MIYPLVAIFILTSVTLAFACVKSYSQKEYQSCVLSLGIVKKITYSPDGDLLASYSSGIVIWDTHTNKPLRFFNNTATLSAVFSPDGSTLAATTHNKHSNGDINLWDVASGKLKNTLQKKYNPPRIVHSIDFSPDGSLLASVVGNSIIDLWDVKQGEIKKTIQIYQEQDISSPVKLELAFSPDGSLLVLKSVNTAPSLQFWDVGSEKLLSSLPIDTSGFGFFPGEPNIYFGLTPIVFSPNNKTLVVGNSIVASQGNKKIQTVINYKNMTKGDDVYPPFGLAFDPYSITLVSGGNHIMLWDVKTGHSKGMLRGHKDWVNDVAFNPDGLTLASSSHDQTIKLWNFHARKLEATLYGHSAGTASITFSPDSHSLAVADGRYIKFWDVTTGQAKTPLKSENERVHTVVFSPDGSTLAVNGIRDDSGGLVELWDLSSNKLIMTTPSAKETLNSVTFSPDGQNLVFLGKESKLEFWDIPNGKLQKTIAEHTSSNVKYSPNGLMLAIGKPNDVKILDAESGELKFTIQGGGDSMSFSPDSTLLAFWSSEHALLLWDIANQETTMVFEQYGNPVNKTVTAFSPNGSMLASGSEDHTIKIWDTKSGELITILEEHGTNIMDLDFSPDGNYFASSSHNGVVRLWDVEQWVNSP